MDRRKGRQKEGRNVGGRKEEGRKDRTEGKTEGLCICIASAHLCMLYL